MYDRIEAEQMRANYALALVVAGQTVNSAKSIIAYECAKRGMTIDELRGHRRFRELVIARQEITKILRDRTNLSLPQIGRMLNRDHTTVLHSLRAVEKRNMKGTTKCKS